MKRLLFGLALLMVAAFPAARAEADIVTNGGFEDGTNPPTSGFRTLSTGSTDITGWTVVGHSVDWIGNYWQAAEGHRSLDLAGLGDGGVFQSALVTQAGHAYRLEFAMAGNPDAPSQSVKTMLVTIAGLTTDTTEYTFDTTGHSLGDMGWEMHTLDFVADSNSTALTFENKPGLQPPYYGAALDAVSVVEVIPEPASLIVWSLLGALGITIGWWQRRRHAA